MRLKNNSFVLGKLKHDYLENVLNNYVNDLLSEDPRVIMGSKIGEDAAVIDIPGENYLVAKTDPITFATDEIGYYVVNVNVNDVVCTGAMPKWFQCTVLLPENKTDEDLIKKIFKGIHDTCSSMNITVIGGHTEITSKLSRPIVIGSLLGEVKKDNLVLSSGARSNDLLILTKGIFIEGTAIIARERENKLREHKFDNKFIERCKNFLYNPGISVFQEAILANSNFKINAMHDPTEGGIACGIAEIAKAAQLGILVEEEKISVLPESRKLCNIFGLNPLNTIASGSLLISINESQSSQLIKKLNENGISANIIGKFTNKNKKLLIKDRKGKMKPLEYSEIDEITKIFNKE
ncbi:MAG: AIR synthase family protein [Candidatus Lokiarchaeota archaeon]